MLLSFQLGGSALPRLLHLTDARVDPLTYTGLGLGLRLKVRLGLGLSGFWHLGLLFAFGELGPWEIPVSPQPLDNLTRLGTRRPGSFARRWWPGPACVDRGLALARRLQDYLRWRNARARHPGVLAAQRRERARLRSERRQRWGRPEPNAA